MPHPGELLIPDQAQGDPRGLEVLRAWVASNGLQISLLPTMWNDPAAWGIVIADLIRHLAVAFEQTQDAAQEPTIQRILAGLDAELAAPTDKPTGSCVDAES